MIPGNPSPRVAATRRWRERQQAGLIQLKVEIDGVEFALAAVDPGLLGINQADNRKALAIAARALIQQACSPGSDAGDAAADFSRESAAVWCSIQADRQALPRGSHAERPVQGS